MSIYTKRINYRKIYENHYGTIPVDSEGRKYDIHHIDGDYTNNDPTNLIAVSLQEHYNIHWKQGQWTACLLISRRMKITPKEKSRLISLSNKERVKNGTHNFLDGAKSRENRKREVANGTHHFVGDTNPTYARLRDGTHHFLGGEMQSRTVRERVQNGTHHLLGGEIQKRTAKKKMEDGTHHLLKTYVCPYCKKEGQAMIMARWHGDNCKLKGTVNEIS